MRKSNLWRLLALVLALVMVLGCLAGCNDSNPILEEKEEEEDPRDDLKKHTFNGLTFYLDKDFEEDEDLSDSEGSVWTNGDITVGATVKPADSLGDEITSAKKFQTFIAESYMETFDLDEIISDTENGVPYLVIEGSLFDDSLEDSEATSVVGFYLEGSTAGMIVAVAQDFDEYEDDVIAYATLGSLKDYYADDDGEEEEEEEEEDDSSAATEAPDRPDATRPEEETEETDPPATEPEEPSLELVADEYNGLSFSYLSDMEQVADDASACYYNDHFAIYAETMWVGTLDESITTMDELLEILIDGGSYEADEANGVPYIIAEDLDSILGIYLTGETVGILTLISDDLEANMDSMVALATMGSLEDYYADHDPEETPDEPDLEPQPTAPEEDAEVIDCPDGIVSIQGLSLDMGVPCTVTFADSYSIEYDGLTVWVDVYENDGTSGLARLQDIQTALIGYWDTLEITEYNGIPYLLGQGDDGYIMVNFIFATADAYWDIYILDYLDDAQLGTVLDQLSNAEYA